jgi:hypothetical protein
MSPNLIKAVIGVGLATSLAGCISPQNDRITVGRELKLEVFEGPAPAPEQAVPAQVVAPSVVSIDRDNWKATDLFVPVDGTAHNPIYARRVNETNKTRRQRDLYPTPGSSLELAGGSEGQQQREAAYNVFRAITDVAFLVPRMIWRAPWRTDASPDEAYARYWHPELPPGQRQPLPEETDPFAVPTPKSVTP